MDDENSHEFNLRQPVWIALSQFYLDTDLEDSQLLSILQVINDSPYSIEEVKKIDFFEIYPVLRSNINGIAGVWEGFDEDWLVNKIGRKFKGNKIFSRKLSGLKYWWAKKSTDHYWKRLNVMRFQEQGSH